MQEGKILLLMNAEDSTSTISTKKNLRELWIVLWKCQEKHSTRNSGSNWMLRIIPEQIKNNLQEIIASPFEATVSIGKFHKGLDKPFHKTILEDEHSSRIFCILQEITKILARKRNIMISQEIPIDIKKEEMYAFLYHSKIPGEHVKK